MGAFAIAADLLLAVHASAAVRLFRAHIAALHDLTGERIWQIAGDLDVQLEKALQRDVGGKALNAIVGNSVLGTALRALHLTSYVISQAIHARLAAERVLAWQQFGVAIPVQADATC